MMIVSRARDATHARHLYSIGVTDAVPETIEASLQLSEAALVGLGVPTGPVIASIHEKRDEFRRELQEAAGQAGQTENAPSAPRRCALLKARNQDRCAAACWRRTMLHARESGPHCPQSVGATNGVRSHLGGEMLHGGGIVRRVAGMRHSSVAAAAYLCLWPIPAEPVSWPAQKPPGYTAFRAEHTLVRPAHDRYRQRGRPRAHRHRAGRQALAAMHSGNLIRMEPDGGKQEVFANTGGRVLGFDFDARDA